MLYSNSAAISFERVVRTNQSWAVMAGYVQFPNLGSLGSSISTSNRTKNTGFVVGGEYRFYMKKENRFAAPHGVYWGAYANYFLFNNEQTLTYAPPSGSVSTAGLKMDLSARISASRWATSSF